MNVFKRILVIIIPVIIVSLAYSEENTNFSKEDLSKYIKKYVLSIGLKNLTSDESYLKDLIVFEVTDKFIICQRNESVEPYQYIILISEIAYIKIDTMQKYKNPNIK